MLVARGGWRPPPGDPADCQWLGCEWTWWTEGCPCGRAHWVRTCSRCLCAPADVDPCAPADADDDGSDDAARTDAGDCDVIDDPAQMAVGVERKEVRGVGVREL